MVSENALPVFLDEPEFELDMALVLATRGFHYGQLVVVEEVERETRRRRPPTSLFATLPMSQGVRKHGYIHSLLVQLFGI